MNFGRSVIIAYGGLKSQDVEILDVLRFFEKTNPYAKILKILFRKFSSTLLSSNIEKYVRREIGEIVRHLVDQ